MRDAFVFAFYAGGMRFSDVCRLKASDVVEGRANYRMMKTGTPMSVPLPRPALAIAEKYAGSAKTRGGFLFPFLKEGDDKDGVTLRRRIGSRNAQANTALKRMAKRRGSSQRGYRPTSPATASPTTLADSQATSTPSASRSGTATSRQRRLTSNRSTETPSIL